MRLFPRNGVFGNEPPGRAPERPLFPTIRLSGNRAGVDVKWPRWEGFKSSWLEYRRLRRTMFLAWIAPFPVIALLTLVIGRLFGTVTPCFGLVAIWLGLFVWSAGRFAQFSCPRCGAYFAGGPGWGVKTGVFARHCQQCGLGKYRDSDDEN